MNLLNTIRNLYEKVDPQDTGGAEETSMIMGQVKQMRHYLEGIEERVAKDGDVEEWVQNKLTKATDYLKTVYGYKLGKDDSEGMNEEVELDEAQKLFMFTTKAEAQKKAKEIGGKVLELKRAMDGNMFAVLHKDLTKEELKMSIGEGKTYGLTQSLLDAVKGVLNADNTNDVSDDGDEMDKVQPKALKKKFKDRKDKDIDNDGDVDDSDEYLHKKRKAVSKAIDKEEEVDDKEVEKKAKAEKDVDDDDKDDNKKAMAKVADDDDEKSDEEKQKEKELIAKKSDRKEKINTKPTMGEAKVRGKEVYDKTFANKKQADDFARKMGGRVKLVGRVFYVFKEDISESSARKRLSGMMKDKANVKNVRIPTPAERRAQMAKQNAGKKKNPNSIFASTNEEVELDEAKFTDKQIKMAYGVLNDPRYKGGNLSGATKAIEKIARGLSKHPSVMKAMKATSEQVIVKELNIKEAEMTPEQEKKREEIVMAMKKKMPEFEAKYGDRAKEVMYATATKLAMKD